MRVAIVSGARSLQPAGLESAERRLLDAMRSGPDGVDLDVRVVGGRAARRYAREIGARWYPARPRRMPRRASRSAELVHLLGLDLPPPRAVRFLATVHDLAALRFPDEGRLPDWVPELAARASRVLTPSRFTAGEVERRLGVPPERIRVIPNGPGQQVSPDTTPLAGAERADLGLADPFVLRIGGYTKRKNVPLLLEAWPDVRRRTGASLALAGPPHAARESQLAAAPSRDGVVALDYVPGALLPRLIRTAAALVSTSSYEGFGLPPLEAMAAGTPVVAVRAPFVEEVCGDAALLVDAHPAALADGLVRVLEDRTARARLRAVGLQRAEQFSWQRSARALLAVYAELA